MHLTPRALQVLRFLRRFKFVDRALVQRCFFPKDRDGSVTREFLRKLVAAGFARKLRAEVADPLTTSTAPVYVPTESGCCVLATHAGDMGLLLDCAPNTRAWVNLRHWVCLSALVVTLEEALAAQSYVSCPRVLFEHDVVNPEAIDPQDRFKLYTEISKGGTDAERRLVCVPDAALELRVGSFGRAYYVEVERGLDTPSRVAASKTPGYQGLFESRLFQRHFPSVTDFRVLAVCPSAGWRDALRREVAKRKKGAERWLFASRQDLTARAFLHEPVVFGCEGEGRPLVKPPPASPPAAPAPGLRQGHLEGQLV